MTVGMLRLELEEIGAQLSHRERVRTLTAIGTRDVLDLGSQWDDGACELSRGLSVGTTCMFPDDGSSDDKAHFTFTSKIVIRNL